MVCNIDCILLNNRCQKKNIVSKIEYVQRYALLLILITVLEENGNKIISWEVSSNLLNLKGLFCIKY